MIKTPVVLVIRNDDRFSALLRKNGCNVLNLELIKTEPAADLRELDTLVARIDDYDGLFFTSPVAAEVFVNRSKAAGIAFSGKAYVLGERAKDILNTHGLDVQYRSTANTAEELVGSFEEEEFAGKRFLFVRGDKSLRTIPLRLNANAQVDEVVVYLTKQIRPDEMFLRPVREQLSDGDIDWVCFFSTSGVNTFNELIGSEVAKNTNVAAIGETTAKKAIETDLNVQFISNEPNAEDFAKNLIEHIKSIE